MQPRHSKTHFAACHLCEKKKLVRWLQRGITYPEWIRACYDCEHLLSTQNRRNPKDPRQLDLFAK